MRSPTLAIIALILISSATFALNESTTMVLHANDGIVPCEYPQQNGLDCQDGRPRVSLAGLRAPVVFLYLHNYDESSGLQCAFDWPAPWTYIGSSWNCQSNGMLLASPAGRGPDLGTLVVYFDPITGGVLAPIGRMIFGRPEDAGCLAIIESRKYGAQVCDVSGVTTPIPASNRGEVCLGYDGHDACWPAATPVDGTSWGRIKSRYRDATR